MSEQPETPPQGAQQPATAAPLNGAMPTPEEPLAERVAREVTLTWRAVEELDMRVRSIQIGAAVIIGFTLLILALEARRLRP